MIDSRFRPFYQKFLVDPILNFSIVSCFSPNQITAMSTLFGALAGALLAFHYSVAAIATLLISGFLDTLDGSLARHQKASSPKGTVFDITSDRLVEFSIILGLYLYAPESRALPSLLMLGSVLLCITSFLVVGIFSENQSEKSFHYSPGLIERTEAFAFWIAMVLFPSLFSPLAYAFTALVFLTSAIRLAQFSRQNS